METTTDVNPPLCSIFNQFWQFRQNSKQKFLFSGIMNVPLKWPKILSIGYIHKRVFFFSLLFLLIVLSLDCFFQTLPISGYGLVLVTLIVIGCTTCTTCHGIKWIINATKPLKLHLSEKSQNEKWLRFITEFEDDIFRKIFSSDNKFESFKYPTNLNEQIRLLLKDIERDFVKVWYSEISQNPSFLFDSHLILEEIFFKLINKLKTISWKNIILSILILYLNHLQEYKKAVKKMVRINEDDSKPKTELPDLCRYSHPGSQNDEILNYYLKKISNSLLKEFAPHDFTDSLECKILAGIVGRKFFRRLLIVVEDPNWINLKLIYLLNQERHKGMVGDSVYIVKEKIVIKEEEFQFKKPLLSKSILSSNIFDTSRNLFDRNDFHNDSNGKTTEDEKGKGKRTEKESLTLPLHNPKIPFGETKGNISTVLSGLISSTAGPLLPDNISVRYQALNKMWQSPVADVKKDISESISNSFRKVFDGIKEKKGMARSKSTEFLGDTSGSLKNKDVSVGEELCENIRFGGTELANRSVKIKKLTKTRSFDNDSLTMEDVTNGDLKDDEDKSSSPGQQGDVSPVYEEPEDFATTIAKLRSLLQQRESSSTLSDKSNVSIESHSVGYSLDKSDSSNKSQSLEGGDSFESQIPRDIPTDGRLFINVSIPKGELVTDSTGSPCVMYTIQYDGIYMLKDEHNAGSDPELVLQTTIVKRRFQEFLQLQSKLEENSQCRAIIKGIKGPSKWLQMSGKIDESSTPSRRAHLESFLRQLCSKVEISNLPEVHEFLGYGQKGSDTLVKKSSESSLQRIDKLLANKVTGVFNSIKTALPSFDFDSTALVATNDTVKSFQEQKLLQGFLNFGNKPDFFELNLSFTVREPMGETLTDDIRHFFNDKSDCVEDAVDVLDSSDWLSEQRECMFLAEEKCVWHGYKDFVLDDELEPLDSLLPVYSLLLDIICELLQESDCWAIKESVIRVAKVALGHWEQKFEEELLRLDWDRFCANMIRLLRGAVFQPEGSENIEPDKEETRAVLKEVILQLVPEWTLEFVQRDSVASAVSLFVDSLQHFQLNQDVLLRLMDIILAHLLSCPHLTSDAN